LNQPSRRKLFLRELGQASKNEVIIYENAAGRDVCCVHSWTYPKTEGVGVSIAVNSVITCQHQKGWWKSTNLHIHIFRKQFSFMSSESKLLELLDANISPKGKQIFELLGSNLFIALEFFAVFSRFECALKCANKDMIIKVTEKDFQGERRRAEPNWDCYANYLNKIYKHKTNDIKIAAKSLIDKPPQKQIFKETGELDWEDSKHQGSELTSIFLQIRDVRNNLFHGGKYPGQDIRYADVDGLKRDKDLLQACLKVLYICLEIENDVTKAFDSELDYYPTD
jgi:hypothetical protein